MSKELQRLWGILNKNYGIYTLEKLQEEMKSTKLDIGIFTMQPQKVQASYEFKDNGKAV